MNQQQKLNFMLLTWDTHDECSFMKTYLLDYYLDNLYGWIAWCRKDILG